jgi:hypothetical protein
LVQNQSHLISDAELQKLGCASASPDGTQDPVQYQGCSAAAELDLTGLVPEKASFVIITQGPPQDDDTPGILSVCFQLKTSGRLNSTFGKAFENRFLIARQRPE